MSKLIQIRIPNHPETGKERWRVAGLTSTGETLLCLEQCDEDIKKEDFENEIKPGTDIWCWRPLTFAENLPDPEPPKVA